MHKKKEEYVVYCIHMIHPTFEVHITIKTRSLALTHSKAHL